MTVGCTGKCGGGERVTACGRCGESVGILSVVSAYLIPYAITHFGRGEFPSASDISDHSYWECEWLR
jgi:hypothetical protein